MTEKKKAKPPEKPARKGKSLMIMIDAELRDAIDALRKETCRSLTAEVSLALKAHLRGEGYWPPGDASRPT